MRMKFWIILEAPPLSLSLSHTHSLDSLPGSRRHERWAALGDEGEGVQMGEGVGEVEWGMEEKIVILEMKMMICLRFEEARLTGVRMEVAVMEKMKVEVRWKEPKVEMVKIEGNVL